MEIASLGYLGPSGTFSEEAALIYNQSHRFELLERPTVAQVIEGVVSGSMEQGIVPLENSLEGSIAITFDLLTRLSDICIFRELIYPIRQCLMAPAGTDLARISRVYSHPQALGQCRDYLASNLPGASGFPVESTAAAASMVANIPGSAAIAPRKAAALFGLHLLAEEIQDNADNETRFVIIARREHPPTGCDKTSLVLAAPDGPGSLYHILGYFYRHHVNLTRIESRPARRSLSDWLFYIDCEGHRSEPALENLMAELSQQVPFIKLLGSYPRE